eukprot:7505645-Alexandrium_andersonii.AAC.1
MVHVRAIEQLSRLSRGSPKPGLARAETTPSHQHTGRCVQRVNLRSRVRPRGTRLFNGFKGP